MNHRPYPKAARAVAQLKRHPGALRCPVCGHEAHLHGAGDGVRTCTAGPPASCSQCEADWSRAPALRGIVLLGRALNRYPRLVVFSGRKTGKTAALQAIEADALARGEHVHRMSAIDGEHCLGGIPRCFRAPRAEPQDEGAHR